MPKYLYPKLTEKEVDNILYAIGNFQEVADCVDKYQYLSFRHIEKKMSY